MPGPTVTILLLVRRFTACLKTGVRGVTTLEIAAPALPDINTELSGDVLIGTNTVDCMKSGSIIGTASMMDGMALRYKEAIGQDAAVIATGGLASTILPF